MQIEPFGVEQWMNAHETTARWNTAETCVHSLRLEELLAMTGDADAVLRRLLGTSLTYGHITGSPELRAAVAALYGDAVTADDVLVAGGAINANFLVDFALVEPGDTVVCVKPAYQQLYSVPEALGAQVRSLPLRPENRYLPDVDELRGLVDGRTKLIVINNPNNPSGALMDAALLGDIAAVADECGAYLHCDEVYRGLEHDGATPPSVVDLYSRGISTGSVSKAFSLAGLRTGWIVAPPAVLQACLDRRDYTTISCGVLDDIVATLALTHADLVLARSRAIAVGNAEVLDSWLRREPRLSWVRPRAGTTALIHYAYPAASVEFCQGLFDFNGGFVVPGACFEIEHAFRIGYACAREVLEGGLEAISAYLRALEA